MAEVLKTSLGGIQGRWYLDPESGYLLAVEITIDPNEDPCEIHFANPVIDMAGRRLPRDWIVVHGDKTFARLKVSDWKVNP
jgi:hypothetical protein